MYSKKSFLGGLITAGGLVCLVFLAVMFSFTEVGIPTFVYAAAWISCLYIMMKGTARLCRGRERHGSSRSEKCVSCIVTERPVDV